MRLSPCAYFVCSPPLALHGRSLQAHIRTRSRHRIYECEPGALKGTTPLLHRCELGGGGLGEILQHPVRARSTQLRWGQRVVSEKLWTLPALSLSRATFACLARCASARSGQDPLATPIWPKAAFSRRATTVVDAQGPRRTSAAIANCAGSHAQCQLARIVRVHCHAGISRQRNIRYPESYVSRSDTGYRLPDFAPRARMTPATGHQPMR